MVDNKATNTNLGEKTHNTLNQGLDQKRISYEKVSLFYSNNLGGMRWPFQFTSFRNEFPVHFEKKCLKYTDLLVVTFSSHYKTKYNPIP